MRTLILLLIMLNISGCSAISYYSQSIQGQLSILLKREKIQDVIDNPDTPEELRHNLQQATEIRRYASEKLDLPDNESYLYYADLERPYVVWNVFAAPEFSLTPKTWCYFIVGCVSYRGYFAKDRALETAAALKQENYDVHVAGIAAYSTLGWFDDPLLNTMMHWSSRSLASLIFHELSHQIIYISSETSFNEAYSTAVERLGTIQWLSDRQPEKLAAYLDYLNAQADFRQLLLNSREKLHELYQSDRDTEAKRNQKQKIILDMKTEYETLKLQWPPEINFDGWFASPINNARLTATMTYLQKVPAFYQIFMESNGEWKSFFKSILALEEMEKTERERFIEQKLASAPDIHTLVELIQEKPKR